MNILKSSILYQTIQKASMAFMRAYQNSMLYVLVKHLKTAYAHSVIMSWLLSRNAEKGILQQSIFFRLMKGIKNAMDKLMAALGKPFRTSLEHSGLTTFSKAITQSFRNTPLALIGLMGFVFMLANLIVSVAIAKGFTYPGTVLRAALLLVFLMLMGANVEGKALRNSSVILRFIKYMID
jgi:hypothetical protein